ncbi:N-acetylmuramoyl-L-alanine amidase [hydrothermal vent metagenome]|uniref:N-acetylmuramoyl-L-alanine amidase n=1 Tax=hydrothermal vent metagenome TaxID=652676 RepID=A0A3B0ZM63_9ZZZZ
MMLRFTQGRLLAYLWRFGAAVLLFSTAAPVFAASNYAAEVKTIRMWPAPDNTRLVFDLSAPIKHTLFNLKSPNRLVIDLSHARMRSKPSHLDFAKGFVKDIRYASRNRDDLRIVLDLRSTVRPKSFLLKPNREYGHRLVIDLIGKQAVKKTKPANKLKYKNRQRDIIVAIDAGHGGEDPGAIGRRGTREKTVVMAIAKRLEKLVKRERGMRPVMIRTGDYYVSLKKRVKIARRKQADIFISIHADAFRNAKAKGTSVFVVSDRGASSEAARFLAEQENQSDMIGGIDFEEIDDALLKLVLVDMVKNSTMETSHQVASHVLGNLGKVAHLHKKTVEQAGFRVLKAPDIPSILVETAFISNPAEERKLRSGKHQQRIAVAILKGVRSYFHTNPPPGSLLALGNTNGDTKHRVTRGETLSAIASRYRVSIATIRSVNKLVSDRIRVGAVLRIPYRS